MAEKREKDRQKEERSIRGTSEADWFEERRIYKGKRTEFKSDKRKQRGGQGKRGEERMI